MGRKLFLPNDTSRLEVSLRAGVVGFICVALAVAYIPTIVPVSDSFLLGMVGCMAATQPPYLLCTIGLFVPTIYVWAILVLCMLSYILAAATVSDGFMCVVFAIHCMLVSGLYFGKDSSKNTIFATVFIAVPGLLSLSWRAFVEQNGLPGIRQLWGTGLENPLAFNTNFLLMLAWVLVAVVAALLIPPWRTARKALSRAVAPGVLALGASVFSEDDGKDEATTNKLTVLKMKMAGMCNLLANGSVAGITILEPRLFQAPGEGLVVPLVQLLGAVSHLNVALFTVVLLVEEGKVKSGDFADVEPVVQMIQASAKALQENDADFKSKISGDEEAKRSPDSEIMALAQNVVDATCNYLDAFNHPDEQSFMNLDRLVRAAFSLGFAPLRRVLFEMPPVIVDFKRWSLHSILWAAKRSAGLVALFCASIYWKNYANFAIETAAHQIGGVYTGWHLTAYSFSWTPTMEGTFKKGLKRLAGTALGGFAAWLGVIICSGSYDNNAEMNPYGTVAYLTIMVIGATYVARKEGSGAFFGNDPDWNHVGMYFIMVCALVMMEVFYVKGSRDELVVNRLVANITGILMALVVVSIPPFIRGGDPVHAKAYHRAMAEALIQLCGNLLDGKTQAKDHNLMKTVAQRRQTAAELLKDANSVNWLPIHKVNPKLPVIMNDMTIEEALLLHLTSTVQNRNKVIYIDETVRLKLQALVDHWTQTLAAHGSNKERPKPVFTPEEKRIYTETSLNYLSGLVFPGAVDYRGAEWEEVTVSLAILVAIRLKSHMDELESLR